MAFREGYHWLTRPPLGAMVDVAHPLAQGLVGCLLTNEIGNGTLFSSWIPGPANSLTLASGAAAPTWTGGQDGPALKFVSGSSQFCSNTTAVPFSNYPLSVTCWFNTTSITAPQAIWCTGKNSATSVTLDLRLNATGHVACNAAGGSSAISGAAAVANTWSHAAGVWASATSRAAYLNGGSLGTSAISVGFPSGMNETDLGALVGSTRGTFFSGKLAVLKMWSIALTTDLVEWDYNEPYAMILPPNHRRWFVPASGVRPKPPLIYLPPLNPALFE
jgi:hypothetical protein